MSQKLLLVSLLALACCWPSCSAEDVVTNVTAAETQKGGAWGRYAVKGKLSQVSAYVCVSPNGLVILILYTML
jgi:hypothetical protein